MDDLPPWPLYCLEFWLALVCWSQDRVSWSPGWLHTLQVPMIASNSESCYLYLSVIGITGLWHHARIPGWGTQILKSSSPARPYVCSHSNSHFPFTLRKFDLNVVENVGFVQWFVIGPFVVPPFWIIETCMASHMTVGVPSMRPLLCSQLPRWLDPVTPQQTSRSCPRRLYFSQEKPWRLLHCSYLQLVWLGGDNFPLTQQRTQIDIN